MKTLYIYTLSVLISSACLAQTDMTNDCKVLRAFFNDTSVKNYLDLRPDYTVFRNESSFFRDCKTVKIGGQVFRILDTSWESKVERIPNYMFITKGDNGQLLIKLTDSAGEREKMYSLTKQKDQYIVKWIYYHLLD